ncbi:MAG: 16S rRNA (guanine(966)-N(2))-methyltransferase RsmD [Actinomycetota bacterium]
MRIIAGEAKGRRLNAPRSGTRPFTGRAKEAVFSSLHQRIPGARVLDLYAGSGSLGLEALSRGASSVVFVEKSTSAVAVLKENVSAVGLGGNVVRADVVAHLRRDRDTYDVVFSDPPYAFTDEDVADVLQLVADRVVPGGVVVLHRRAGGTAPDSDNLRCTDRRRYGDSEIWILEKEQE